MKFIKRERHNLRDEDNVVYLLDKIQEGIEAKMQIKHANMRRNNNNFKNNEHASTHDNDDKKISTDAARRAITTFGPTAL